MPYPPGESTAGICQTTKRVKALEADIERRAASLAPTLIALQGCGSLTAAKIVAETAGIDRFADRATFARHNGTAPVPVWSDWTLSDVNLQVGRADVVLSELGIKRLVLEVKRPGSLAWHRHAVEAALDQALGYAASQRVGAVAVSDGHMLYAADIAHGGLRDRLFVTLESNEAPLELWWVSVHGIYRPCPKPTMALPSAPTT